MQKWLPDAFEVEDAIRAATVDKGAFEPETGAAPSGDQPARPGFRSEAGFADSQSLLNHLTQRERAQLFDLVEQDVAAEYQEREDQIKAATEQEMQSLQANFQASLQALATQLEEATTGQLQEIAAAAARLAVQLAGKIVRSTVEVDPQVLARVLETTLYKLTGDTQLTVSLNPEDAAWLEGQPELCKELKIGRITPDRRIERGGCIASGSGQEWDATLARQLESLTEIVEEAIATGAGSGRLLPGEDPDES